MTCIAPHLMALQLFLKRFLFSIQIFSFVESLKGFKVSWWLHLSKGNMRQDEDVMKPKLSNNKNSTEICVIEDRYLIC